MTSDANQNMQFANVPYVAFGEAGERVRDAREIGELPWEMRKHAAELAERIIAELLALPAPHRIKLGVPVYQSFDIRPADAKRHHLSVPLMTRDMHVPLHHCA